MNQQNPNRRRSAPSGTNRAPGQVPRDPQNRQGYPDPRNPLAHREAGEGARKA